CALRGLCFLSDRVGWVAGGGTAPYTRRSYGVVLATSDGGRTWTPLVAPPSSTKPSDRPQDAIASRSGESPAPRQAVLSRIRWIRFFSRDEGVAVGEGTGADPSGAFSTVDGGKSWQPLPGRVSPGWFAAEFVRPDAGILVGA